MLQSGSYSAWIEVNGFKLDLLSEERSADGGRISCWIASTAGTRFSIHWDDDDRSWATRGKVTIDGHYCGDRVLLTARNPTKAMKQESVYVSKDKERFFEFGNLEVTDNEDHVTHLDPTERIGEISLELWKGDTVQSPTDRLRLISVPSDNMMIHERSKKAGAHNVRFGSEVTCKERSPVSFHSNSNDPEVTFLFRYRPLELLKAQGVAPTTNSQKRRADSESTVDGDIKPENDDGIDLSDESVENERIKALEVELTQLRQQQSHRHRSKRSRTMKAEPESTLPLFYPGEVIDLT